MLAALPSSGAAVTYVSRALVFPAFSSRTQRVSAPVGGVLAEDQLEGSSSL